MHWNHTSGRGLLRPEHASGRKTFWTAAPVAARVISITAMADLCPGAVLYASNPAVPRPL